MGHNKVRVSYGKKETIYCSTVRGKTATKVKRGRRRSDIDSIAGDDRSVTMPLVPGGLRRHVDAQTRSKDDANCLHRICTDIQLFTGQISSNVARKMKQRAARRPILDYADSALRICGEHFFRHQTTSPRDKYVSCKSYHECRKCRKIYGRPE